MANYEFDDSILVNLLAPLLSFLSSILPPPLFSVVETFITYSIAVFVALFGFVYTLISSSSLDAEKILPPLITLLAAYLALVSFYRTTGWMIRTTFWCVKWGGILGALAAGAGYFLGNANVNGANGVGAFNGGIVSLLGNALLGIFSEDTTPSSRKSRSNRNTKPRMGASTPKTRKQKEKGKERPKAWESWDKHKDWQYSATDAATRDEAVKLNEGVQEAIQKMTGIVQGTIGTGWWETFKNTVEGSGLVGTSGEGSEGAQTQRKSKQDRKGRGSSR